MQPKSKEYKLAEVITIVSHQLKTPLSVIKGYVEVLISEDVGKTNPKQREYLKDTLENIQRMIILVKDLLDVSTIEEEKMEFKLQRSSLEKIVKETLKEFSSLAKAKNRTISFETIGKIPLLNIDPMKIKQVVSNLVSNAIEYNKRSGLVNVSIKRDGKNVVFCCKDIGIGISEKEKKESL